MTKQTICFFPIVHYQAELFCKLANTLLGAGIINKVIFVCPSVSSYEYVKDKFPCYLTADLLKHADPSKDVQNLSITTEWILDLFEIRKLKVEERYYCKLRQQSVGNIQQEAISYCTIWDSFLSIHEIDTLFVWNGYIVPQQTLIAFARRKKIKVLYFENGYKSDTFVIDPVGINAKSSFKTLLSTSRSTASYSTEKKIESVTPPKKINNYLRLRSKIKLYQFKYRNVALFRYEFSQPVHVKLLHLLESFLQLQKLSPKEPYIFFPLQVITDSQLIENYGQDQSEVVEQIALLLDQINVERDRPIEMIVKEHPRQETRRYMNELRSRIQSSYIKFTRLDRTNDLIRNAAAVITINSSVGYQALKMKKNVFVLGETIYEGPGLGMKVDDLNEIKKQLLQIIDNGDALIDSSKVNEFVERYEKFCYSFSYTDKTSQKIVDNIKYLLDIGGAQ
ncbi:capsular polysaccharide export protein, LipB/KpsS family [Paenibacillus apis]|uniref:Capsule polysaccharide biosynthesis protein n=1 Tax=Paenibacillus apis TaxID=1792174 RepID=A0A919XZ46_9BACL|nr:hypothetical protein [Paenibacillus apis]GIO41961.1 hypothetical protein J41TS4_17190 [Paenibacillus apis]